MTTTWEVYAIDGVGQPNDSVWYYGLKGCADGLASDFWASRKYGKGEKTKAQYEAAKADLKQMPFASRLLAEGWEPFAWAYVHYGFGRQYLALRRPYREEGQ